MCHVICRFLNINFPMRPIYQGIVRPYNSTFSNSYHLCYPGFRLNEYHYLLQQLVLFSFLKLWGCRKCVSHQFAETVISPTNEQIKVVSQRKSNDNIKIYNVNRQIERYELLILKISLKYDSYLNFYIFCEFV